MISVDLGVIAAHLEGLEETIIHRLIDRAQFRENPAAYTSGTSGFRDAGTRTLFDLRLRYQEEMDAAFGRFQVPEECPFHDDLPVPHREVSLEDSPLDRAAAAAVNCTPEIVKRYLEFLPSLCDRGDDGQYGSSVEHDVLAIQAALDAMVDFRGDTLLLTPGLYSLATAINVNVEGARVLGPPTRNPASSRATLRGTGAGVVPIVVTGDNVEMAFMQLHSPLFTPIQVSWSSSDVIHRKVFYLR